MSGGALGRVDLRQPEDLEVGIKRLHVYDDVLSAISGKGLVMPSLPGNGFNGELPGELTLLNDNQLGDLLSKLATYCGYVDTELAKASVERDIAKYALEFVRAKIRLSIKSSVETQGKLTTKDKDDLVETDPRVVEATSRAIYTDAVYSITKTILNMAERSWDTVSRRITQRGQDIERSKREVNVSNIQRPGHRFSRG